jgi:TPR repeat protein
MPDYAEMSVEALEKAGRKSKDPEELVTIASALLERSEAEPAETAARARALAERANQIQPTARAYWLIGQLARNDDRHEDALAAFRAASALAPYDDDYWTLIAGEQVALGDRAGADRAIARALALAPTSVTAHYQAATIAAHDRRFRDAWYHWATMIADDSESFAELTAEVITEQLGDADPRAEQARALVQVAGDRIRLARETKNLMRDRAADWAQDAIDDEAGDLIEARVSLAMALCDHETRGDEAAAIAQALVETCDHPDAHCLLGWLRLRGQGIAKDEVASRRHHERAAAAGVADSQFELSIFFDKGIGGDADPAAARVWEQRAADQGHGRALLNLGSWAAMGTHGPVDMAKAVAYYERAAAAGYADAADRLSKMYVRGAGVEEDISAGSRWHMIAYYLGIRGDDDGDAGSDDDDDDASDGGEVGVVTPDMRMHMAVHADDVDALKAAIADGADVESLDPIDRTALLAAAWDGKLEIVRALLDAGADPNPYKLEVMFVAVLDTPLERARAGKHKKVVKLLLERGALEREALPDPAMLAVEASGTPDERLSEALWADDPDRVARALADGANASGCHHGMEETNLAAAVRMGKPAFVKLLLDAGADPNAREDGKKNGRPLVHGYFQSEEAVACFELLLAAGADPNVKYEGDWVAGSLYAEAPLKARMLRALLAHGYEVDRKHKDGGTILHSIVQDGVDLELFELAIAKGADPRQKHQRMTLAETATYSSGKAAKKMLKRLIELGVKAPD